MTSDGTVESNKYWTIYFIDHRLGAQPIITGANLWALEHLLKMWSSTKGLPTIIYPSFKDGRPKRQSDFGRKVLNIRQRRGVHEAGLNVRYRLLEAEDQIQGVAVSTNFR